MSGIMSVDHHADFAGWNDTEAQTENKRSWSARQKALCVVACSIASWVAVIGPFVLID
tara:strand:- start:303 stop:476 length:174 start_codon:yes stop_codon:yes gene_type:complete